MKDIDYLCGMNFVEQYRQAIQYPSAPHIHRTIEYVLRMDLSSYSLGPYGETFDSWGVPFHVWGRRGQTFASGNRSMQR